MKSRTEIIYNSRFTRLGLDLLFVLFRAMKQFIGFSNDTAVVISIHKLGDTVFTLPAIRWLVSHQRYSKIIIITNEHGAAIYKSQLPGVEYIIVNRSKFLLGEKIVEFSLWPALIGLRAGTVFDFSGGVHSASIGSLIMAQEHIGINTPPFRKLFTTFISIRNTPHIIDIYLDIIREYFGVSVSKEDKTFVCSVKNVSNILLAPLGGWKAKEWGMHNFVKLAENLKKKFSVSFVTEAELLSNDIKAEILAGGFNLIETKNLPELIQAINRYDLFISNDTGPLYIANLQGKATYAIYGPTNPDFHIPYGEGHGYSMKKLPCSPVKEKYCYTLGGRYCFHFSCMAELNPAEVSDSVVKFIDNFNTRNELNA